MSLQSPFTVDSSAINNASVRAAVETLASALKAFEGQPGPHQIAEVAFDALRTVVGKLHQLGA